MKPIILTGHRRYEVVWFKGENDNHFNASRNQEFDNGLKFGWIEANSPQEAWKKAKGRDKRYGIRNPQTKEYFYPPKLVEQQQEIYENSKSIPF